ncbi:hypothetical protein BASA81_011070 [Batrachochytrium salamandrivorans]|nr:hypothetical protein BASA81_011070 [Batrachochytrium salamandrivorans]
MRSQFDRDGFVVVRDALRGVDFSQVQSRCEGLFRGEFETGAYPDEWHWRQGMSLPLQTKEICNAWKSDLVLASLVMKESLAQLVGELMGWESVRIAQDDVILKPAGGGSAVGLHQDSAYISTNFALGSRRTECLSVTMWIPLEFVDAGNGSLTYVKGSHLLPTVGRIGEFHAPNSNHHNSLEAGEMETMIMHPGDVVIHHESTWHFSRPNHSPTRSRNVLVIHYLRGMSSLCKSPPTSMPGTNCTGA